ncbi:MAG: PAS domain-containing protein [Burkholderiales bacterium]|jgi:signal transduction histidine kinase|nr:PAS domain-containing protein [Burkholderiales bacterium]
MAEKQLVLAEINNFLISFKHLLEGSQMGFWLWKSELFSQGLGTSLFDNDDFLVCGHPFEQLDLELDPVRCSMKKFSSMVHPEDAKVISENLRNVLTGKLNCYSLRYRVLNRQGKYISFSIRGYILLSPVNNQPMAIYGSAEVVPTTLNPHDAPNLKTTHTPVTYEVLQAQEDIARLNTALPADTRLVLWQWHAENASNGIGSSQFLQGTLSGPESFLSNLGYPASRTMKAVDFCKLLIYPDDLTRFNNAIQDTFTHDTPFDCTYRLQHKAGDVIWVQVLGQVKRCNNGLPLHMVGTIESVQEDNKAAMLLMKEVGNEKSVSSLRLNTLYAVSHDLANPLAAVKFAARLGKGIPKETANYKERIHQQFDRVLEGAERMGRLIEDSVTLARVCNTREFKQEDLRLQGEVLHWVGTLCQQHKKNPEDVLIDVQPEVIIHNIPLLPMSNMLSNLIGNAIKYTPVEGAKVRISYSLTEQGRKHRIIIEDEGIGVPEKLREELFQPFNRGDNVAHIKGRGLGLAIVKKSVELLEGSVRTDHLPQGTRFTVELPNKDFSPWQITDSP